VEDNASFREMLRKKLQSISSPMVVYETAGVAEDDIDDDNQNQNHETGKAKIPDKN